MPGDNNKKFTEFAKKILKKIQPRFSFHYVAYTSLFTFVVFSVVSLATATTPNPGHPWSELGDGVFTVANTQTVNRTYTFPDANATVLTTNSLVTVAQGGTGLGTIAAGSVFGANTLNTLSAITSVSGTKVLTNTAGTITWEVPASGMVYPASGIPNSTGSAWGTSYSTNGSGTVLALTNSPSFTTPTLGAATATTINGLTLTSAATGFTIAGGTISKTLTVGDTASVSGTNTGDETTTTIKTKLGAAATGADGYLTSTDWNTFNGKQAALTNPVTGTGTQNYISKFSSTGSTLADSLIFDNGTTVGIGNNSPVSLFDVTKNALGVTVNSTSGITLSNTTAAAAAAQQISPSLHFKSFGWGTTLASSQSTDWIQYALPVQGTTPTTNLLFASSVAGAGYTTRLTLTSAGALTATGGLAGTTGAFSSTLTNTRTGLVVTSTDGTILTNTTAALVGTPVQISPRLRLSGTVWDTGAVASRTVNFKNEVLPISGNPGTAKMLWGYDYNGGGYTEVMSVSSAGNLTALGTITGSNLSGTNTGDNAPNSLYSGIVSMVYPGAGIPNSTGSAWGTSYSTTGSGTVLALAITPTFTTNITAPLVLGGSTTTSGLTLQTTSGVGAAGADMHFKVGNAGGTEALTILNNGNVGIGSSDPTTKLHIFDKSNAYATINIEGPTDTADQGSAILFNEGNGATQWNGGLYGFKQAYDGGNNYMYFEGFANGTSQGKHLSILRTGNIGIGPTSPTAALHIKAGTAVAGTAPLKFTSGTNLTTAEAGAMEWNGTNLFITQTTGPTRKTLAYTTDIPSVTGYVPYTGATGPINLGINNLTVDTNTLFVDSVNHRLGVGTLTPLASLDVAGRTIKLSNLYPEYKWQFGGDQDLNWKTIANVNLGTGSYVGVEFEVTVLDTGNNFGNSPDSTGMKYYVALTRSGGVQDDFNDANLSGPVADYVRAVKTATGVYELQVRQIADYRVTEVSARAVSINSLGSGGSIAYVDSPVNGSTTGTIYSASPVHTDYFTYGYFAGHLSVGTTNNSFPLNIRTDPSDIDAWRSTTSDFNTTTSTGSSLSQTFGSGSGNVSSRLSAMTNGGTVWGDLGLQVGGGKVGVGIANPSDQFEVQGLNNGGVLSLSNSNTVIDAYGERGSINFRSYDTSTDAAGIGARIIGRADADGDHSEPDRGTQILFQTVDENSSTLMDRMLIKENGFVGIGDTSPSTQLSVTYNDPSSTTIASGLTISNGSDVTGSLSGINFSTYADVSGGIYAKQFIGVVRSDSGAGHGDIVFLNRNTNDMSHVMASDERMRITSSGNVGIGTTSPSAKLSVVGDISVTGLLPTGGQNLVRNADLSFGDTFWAAIGGGGTIAYNRVVVDDPTAPVRSHKKVTATITATGTGDVWATGFNVENLKTNTDYNASCYFKTTDTVEGYFHMERFYSDWTGRSDANSSNFTYANDGAWHRESFSFNTGAYPNVDFRVRGFTAVGSWDITGCQLTEGKQLNTFVVNPLDQIHEGSGRYLNSSTSYGLISKIISNNYTTTNAYSVYIAAPEGTITNKYAFATEAGAGNVGIGTITPTAALQIKAGTATAGTAPLKLTAGTNLGTAETGAMEYDGTNLYFTPTGTTRKTFAFTSDLTTGYVPYTGATGNVDLGANTITSKIFKSYDVSGTYSNIQMSTTVANPREMHYIGSSSGNSISNIGFRVVPDPSITSQKPIFLEIKTNNNDTGVFRSYWLQNTTSTKFVSSSGDGTGIGTPIDITTQGENYTIPGLYVGNTANQLVGIGMNNPTARLTLPAGTATANTAPLKFKSGALLTTTEAGSVEFLNDAYYGTITTGAGTAGARKQFAFTSDLTTGYVPYTGANANVNLGTYTLTTPTIIGGSSTTSGLTLQTTSGVGTTGADMHFKVGNNGNFEALTILNNGNVGIGNTAPGDTLSIHTNTNANMTVSNGSGVIVAVEAWGAYGAIGNYSNSPLYLLIGDVNKALLDVDGNFGVGLDGALTTATYRLNILNNTTAQTASNRVANFANTGSTFNTTSGNLRSYGGYFSSTSTKSAGTNALSNIGLYVTASGADNNYAAIFDQGRVGIGTNDPSSPLHVASNSITAISNETASDTSYLRPSWLSLRSRGTLSSKASVQNGDWLGSMSFAGYDSALDQHFTAAEIIGEISGGTPSSTSMPGSLVFSTTPVGSVVGVDRMIIDHNGNVGIGSFSPTGKLDIQGLAVNDAPTLSAEFLPGTGWTSTGWTGSFASGWTHTIGNTTVLSQSTAAVSATKYQITYTVTGRTAGTFTIGFGGQGSSTLSATGTWGPTTSSTAGLTITPTTDFNGTIVISIKSITAVSTSLVNLRGSDAVAKLEMRALTGTTTSQFIGVGSGRYNTTANNNTGTGYYALSQVTTGGNNTATGREALRDLTTGTYNTAHGNLSGAQITTGTTNSALGAGSLYSNTTGSNNVAVGYNTVRNGTALSSTTGVGFQALINATGSNNTAIGYQSLGSLTSGTTNTALGYMSGYYITDGTTSNLASTNSLYLGYDTRAQADGQTNQTVIGYSAIGNGSNTVTLGNSSNLRTYLAGLNLKAGTATAGTAPLKFLAGTNLGTTEAGAVEYDGSHLYFTAANGGTRYQLDQQSVGGGATWDTIGDAGGNGAIAFGSTVQTMDWATATTQAALAINTPILTTGSALRIDTGSSITSGSGLMVEANGTSAISGGLIRVGHWGNYTGTTGLLNVVGDSTTGGVISTFSAGALTTGKVLDIYAGNTVTSGNAVYVEASGTSAITNGLVRINHYGNYTGAGGLLNLQANATTTGTLATIEGDSLTTGKALVVYPGDNITSGSAIYVEAGGTSAIASGLVRINHYGNYTGAGGLLNLEAVNTTAGTIANINGGSLTTGRALVIDAGGNLTSGSAIYAEAGGTSALTGGLIRAYHYGNYTGAGGLLNVVADATTAGTVATIEGGSLTTGRALNIIAGSSLTTGNGLMVQSGSTGNMSNGLVRFSNYANYTGRLLYLDGDATTAGGIALLEADALTTGVALAVNVGSTLTSGNGLSVQTGSTGNLTNGLVVFNAYGNFTGHVVEIDGDNTTAGSLLNLYASSLTTGHGLNIDVGSNLTSGVGLSVQTGTAGNLSNGLVNFGDYANFTGHLIEVGADNTTAGTGIQLYMSSLTTGTALNMDVGSSLTSGAGIYVSANGTSAISNGLVQINHWGNYTGTGGLLQVSGDYTQAGRVMNIEATSLTTGTGLNISAGNNLTSGSAMTVYAAGTSAISNGLVVIQHNGNYTGVGGLLQVSGDYTQAGRVMNIEATSLTTGTGLNINAGASVTSGNALRVYANGTSAITDGLVKIVHNGAYTGAGGLLSVDGDYTTAGRLINVIATSLTTGTAFNINVGPSLTSGKGILVQGSGTSAITGSLISAYHSGNFTGTGGLLSVSADATNTGRAASISAAGLTTGTALYIDGGTTQTTGNSLWIDNGNARFDGNVGIGTTTAISNKLEISGGNFKISTGDKINVGDFSWIRENTVDLNLVSKANVNIYADADGTDPGVEGVKFFGSVADTVTTDPLMFIRSDGKVGIGTTSPSYKLDVKGLAVADGIRSDMGFDINQVPDPNSLTGSVSSGGSVDTGDHYYMVTYYTAVGETRPFYANVITTTAGNNTVTLTIPTSTDPRVIGRKIYRTKAGPEYYSDYYLATIANNTSTSYVDTVADSTLVTGGSDSYYRANTTSGGLSVNGTKVLTTDTNATYLGYGAGAAITSGGRNTFVGWHAGYAATTAKDNTFVGHQAGGIATLTGIQNTYLGTYTGRATTSGYSNVAIGHSALSSNTTGYSNVAIGQTAGYYIADGATSNTASSNSIFIGRESKALADSQTNQIVLGYNAIGNGSNTITLGNSSNLRTYLTGLNLKAGTATAGTAPLKFTSGTNLGTAETGAMEYDGTNLYFTPTGTTRRTIAYIDSSITGSANSLKSTATTGLLTVTGMTAGTTRLKTVRDANDTILELGGSYTPTGTWTSMRLNENVALTTTSTKLNYLTSATGTTGTTTSNIVFSTTPTFTTNITTPMVLGGSTTTSGLTLQTTSGVGTTGADMHFKVGNAGGTEAMTILNSGFVGIGNTSPDSRLSVNSLVDNVSIMTLRFPAGAAEDSVGILFKGNDGTYNINYSELTGGVESWSNDDGFIGFRTSKSTVLAERMRLTSNGTLEVGFNYTGQSGTLANGLIVEGRTFIGSTTESTSVSKLSLTGTTAANGSTAGVIGILGGYTFNPTAGGIQVGNRFVITNNPTTTANTAVGEIIRVVDNSGLANLVRGIEVTASAGSNTTGINTGIRSTGATFGVQGVTTGNGAGSVVPAALYGENTGTVYGDILRLYSNSVTSAPSFATFYHDSSTFTGTGLLMDFATGSGAFSGNFADFQKNNVSLFKVTNAGILSMGLSSTASTTAVCSSLANGATPGAGVAYELRDCSNTPVADYAEMYPVEDDIEYGDIVATGGETVNTYDEAADGGIDWNKVKSSISKLTKSNAPYQKNVIGIVSNNHSDFSSVGYNIKEIDNPMPVALNGRVPVKVSSSSESIEVGDYLTTSTDLGKAAKATKAGFVIGKALEAWDVSSGKNTVMVFVEQGYYNGPELEEATFSGLTFFEGDTKFVKNVVFNSQVEFSIPPVFNKDTAGFAIIKEGTKKVEITFENPYIAQPVVSANISLEDSSENNMTDEEADAFFSEGFTSLITNKTQNGFTIRLNKNATSDIRFSWIALSVKDPQIFESVIDGLVIEQEVPSDSTRVTENNSTTETQVENKITESSTSTENQTDSSSSIIDKIINSDIVQNILGNSSSENSNSSSNEDLKENETVKENQNISSELPSNEISVSSGAPVVENKIEVKNESDSVASESAVGESSSAPSGNVDTSSSSL